MAKWKQCNFPKQLNQKLVIKSLHRPFINGICTNCKCINILARTTILQSTKIYDENPKIWWFYCNGGPWMQLNKWEYVEYTCTVQPRGKTQNPRYHQGQNQQFADRRGDSMRTMIVDKFYHFHHHRGITLNADPWWCRAQ